MKEWMASEQVSVSCDEALEYVGPYGRYQCIVFLLIGIVCLRNSLHPFVSVFLAAEPPFRCIQFELVGSNINDSFDNSTDQCYVGNLSQKCTNWEFDESYGNTIVTEWLLVCDRAGLVPLSTSLYMSGVMFGSVFLTPLADRWGRKWAMIGCVFVQSILGAILVLVQDIALFSAIRFALGALNQGVSISGYVLLAEAFPARCRTRPCVLVNVFWPAGMLLLAAMAYLIRDWRHLQLAVSLPSLLIIIYHWSLLESLPWLVSKGKHEKVDYAIRRIGKLNGRPLTAPIHVSPSPFEENRVTEITYHSTDYTRTEDGRDHRNYNPSNGDHCEDNGNVAESQVQLMKGERNGDQGAALESQVDVVKGSSSRTWLDRLPSLILFSTRRMAAISLIVFYMWSVNSLLYYGLSFSIAELHGDRFVNFVLMSLIELPAQILSTFLLDRFGRRPVLIAVYLLGGTSLILSVIVPLCTDSGSTVVLVLGLLGKSCVTASLITVWLYSAEVFPTPARNASVGLAAFFETVGSVAAPFLVYSERWLWYLGPLLYGCMSLLAGFLVVFLPETLNRPLPHTVSDVTKPIIVQTQRTHRVSSS